jgi:hypothetical protein
VGNLKRATTRLLCKEPNPKAMLRAVLPARTLYSSPEVAGPHVYLANTDDGNILRLEVERIGAVVLGAGNKKTQ